MPAPGKSLACHSPNTAPCGSAPTIIQPSSPTCIGGTRSAPPSSTTRLSVLPMSALAKYVVQLAGGSGSPLGDMACMIPATGLPRWVQTEYPPNSCDPTSPCQPKRSR